MMSYKNFRYYKVQVNGRMTSANIHRTCKFYGYVTPCAGRGGRPFTPPPPKVDTKLKGFKVVFGNEKAFIGLKEPVSNLCQTRYHSGRIDARCEDGWQEEAKSAGKPVCEDDNINKQLPCSLLQKSCHKEAVQTQCAHTCGTFEKGSKECKQIAAAKAQFKCVRAFSCTAMPKAFAPSGLTWMKPRPHENQNGCGSQARIEVGGCSPDPKEVRCGCRSAYSMHVHSITSTDCSARAYASEGKKILQRLESLQHHTSQWLSTCSSIEEGAGVYASKPTPIPKLIMKNGASTVWRARQIHSLSIPKSEDGCEGSFTMSMAVCKTAPFKRIILNTPFNGFQYEDVGCGCQEILVKADYVGQITAMSDKMQATQQRCAKKFAEWTLDFQQEYFFGGLAYQGHAVRLAKRIRKQCENAGVKVNPSVAFGNNDKAIKHVMKRNQQSIKKYEGEVQEASARVLHLQREKAQCLATLPPKSDNYKELVSRFAMEPDKQAAVELNSEAIELKTNLNTRDHNDARLHEARQKEKKKEEKKKAQKKKAE